MHISIMIYQLNTLNTPPPPLRHAVVPEYNNPTLRMTIAVDDNVIICEKSTQRSNIHN